MSDDRLRAAFASRAEGARNTDECPPAEQLWAASGGELGGDATAEVVLHTSTCAACAEAWRLAIATRREAGLDDAARVPTTGPIRDRRRAWIVGAAALVAVAAIAVLWIRSGGEPGARDAGVYRGDPEAPMSALDESVPLPRRGATLRWTDAHTGASYAVRVTREDLSMAWQRTVREHEVAIPDDVLAQLPPNATIYWQVTAILSDGRQHTSLAFIARLAGDGAR